MFKNAKLKVLTRVALNLMSRFGSTQSIKRNVETENRSRLEVSIKRTP